MRGSDILRFSGKTTAGVIINRIDHSGEYSTRHPMPCLQQRLDAEVLALGSANSRLHCDILRVIDRALGGPIANRKTLEKAERSAGDMGDYRQFNWLAKQIALILEDRAERGCPCLMHPC